MMLIAFMILYELKVFKFLKQKVTYNILIKGHLQCIDKRFCHTFIYCIYCIQI